MATNDQKTDLLFKQFTGVVNASQLDNFANSNANKFPFQPYILGQDVLIENIPKNLSNISYPDPDNDGEYVYGIHALDLSHDSRGSPMGISYEIPNTPLIYYYKIELTEALETTPRSFYIDDETNSNSSLLKDSIPFLYDPIYKSYFQRVYTNDGTGRINMYSGDLLWLFDYKSGFLQFYGSSTTAIQSWLNNNGRPRISVIVYNGNKGIEPVTLTGDGATTVTGTYPNFTITSTDTNTTYSNGTGVTINGSNQISIGQPVGTGNNVTFNRVTVAGPDLYINNTVPLNSASSNDFSILTDFGNPYQSNKLVRASLRINSTEAAIFLTEGDIRTRLAGLQCYFNGNVYVQGTWRGSSDDRIKSYETDISNATEMVMKLNPKFYKKHPKLITDEAEPDLSDVEHNNEYGFIAQELNEDPHLKHFVNHHPDTSIFHISYMEFIPLLVQTIKELNYKVENLESENTIMKNALNQLLSDAGKSTI